MNDRNDLNISTRNNDINKLQNNEQFLLSCIPRHLLYCLINNPYESLVLVDADGIVQFLSTGINEKIYKIKSKDAVGHHISEISPRTRLHKVLKTGKAEIGRSMMIEDQKRVVARIPLKKGGRVIGAVGKIMFMHPEKLKTLYKRIAKLENHIDYYKKELKHTFGSRYTFENIKGSSNAIINALNIAKQAAATNSAVIIQGESGTGKELFAHAIHDRSMRNRNPFVRVNCASIPNELIESELFGYRSGAFTGANKKGKTGKFELAHKGTIFLDEISDMPLNLQAKLLRVLQEKEIEIVGSNKSKKLDFRVICATNRDLENMVKKGEFRLDLYYRLNVMTLNLPSLRSMRHDISILAYHFLSELKKNRESDVNSISLEAMNVLKKYSWPGNVRELRNFIERALIVCKGPVIELDDLPPAMGSIFNSHISINKPQTLLKDIIEKTEKQSIIEALKFTNNSKVKAAKLLGIHRTGLYQKMKKYHIL